MGRKIQMILCDTDVIIEFLKGNSETNKILSKIDFNNIAISVVTYMEIIFGAFNKKEIIKIRKSLSNCSIIHINEDISNISLNLIENYSKSNGLCIPDAMIAATSMFTKYELFSYNLKDFKYIKDLKLYEY